MQMTVLPTAPTAAPVGSFRSFDGDDLWVRAFADRVEIRTDLGVVCFPGGVVIEYAGDRDEWRKVQGYWGS